MRQRLECPANRYVFKYRLIVLLLLLLPPLLTTTTTAAVTTTNELVDILEWSSERVFDLAESTERVRDE